MEQQYTEKFFKEGSVPCEEKTVFVLATPASPTKKIVLLIHGFLSHKDSETNLSLTTFFLEQGIATIRLDLFGHGESDGPFLNLSLSRCLTQVTGLIGWIKKNGYEKIAIVGSSFGGLIAIHTAASHPEIVTLALKCPVSNYPPLWHDPLGEDGMADWKERGSFSFVSDGKKVKLGYDFYADLLKYNTYRDVARIAVPTLIVHGDADDDVPVDQSIRLIETLLLPASKKRLDMISGADHMFEKPADFNQMVKQISEWVVRFI